MRIVIYHRVLTPESAEILTQFKIALQERNVQVNDIDLTTAKTAEEEQGEPYSYALSVGGDGTLLNVVHRLASRQIPIVGLNFGHLGFLTTVGQDVPASQFVDDLLNGRLSIEDRTLLRVEMSTAGDADGWENTPYIALNEVVIHRPEEVGLLRVSLYVNNHYVATYDGDGLIIATPTGSTAYSLSCGGPILTPDSGCFVLTPIAVHTLAIRPLIVPDSAEIRLEADGPFHLGTDSRSVRIEGRTQLRMKREQFIVSLVRMHDQSFFTAIHEKLAWGGNLR